MVASGKFIMNKRTVLTVIVAAMALLAGCGGGGGGGGGGSDDPASVSILDPQGDATAATPGTPRNCRG